MKKDKHKYYTIILLTCQASHGKLNEKGKMFIKSLTDYLKERANSTVLISLFFFYVLCNCRWIFASLFTDQNLIFEKCGLLKNEYIYQNFVELHPDNFWFWFCIIMPFFLTYMYIWWAPKIAINPAYKRQIIFKNERRKFKIDEENKLLSLKNDSIKEESKTTEAMIQLENKKNQLNDMNPEKLLDEEYRLFQENQDWVAALSDLRDIVYGNYGYVVDDKKDSSVLMLLDVNGLIDYVDVLNDSITVTEKGKAFLKRALEEKLL